MSLETRSDPQAEICGQLTRKDIRTGQRVKIVLLRELNARTEYEGTLEPLGFALFVLEDGRMERTPIPWSSIKTVDRA